MSASCPGVSKPRPAAVGTLIVGGSGFGGRSPGVSPFDAIQALTVSQRDVRVVVFSGHVHADFIEQALNAGVWGYASKNDGEEELVTILRAVAEGHVSLSPETNSAYRG